MILLNLRNKSVVGNLLLMVLSVALTACGASRSMAGDTLPGNGERTLTVFAASSLTDAFTKIGAAFEAANPGVTVAYHFASSSQLAAQLVENVDADVYASANATQMQNVVDAGRITGPPYIFTTNRLTICVPADNPAGLESPFDLAAPGIGLVLAAPEVPVRNYSDQVIAALGDQQFQDTVYANLVSEEANVRQVVTKVALGEADAGMVYVSDITQDVSDNLVTIPIPEEVNVIAQYPIATLDNGDAELGQAFIDFVISDKGQAILHTRGFGVTR